MTREQTQVAFRQRKFEQKSLLSIVRWTTRAKQVASRLLINKLVLLFIVAGCATAPKVSGPSHFLPMQSEFGQWRGSGTVTRSSKANDGIRKESWSISLEVVSRTPGYGRIEIAGTMGVYGGTVAWTPQGTRLLLPTMRKFLYSETSSTAFKAVLPVQLSPLWLERIVFRNEFSTEEMKRAGFDCIKQTAGELSEVCLSEQARIERHYGSDGRIHIVASSQRSDGEAGTLELNLSEVRSKVQERDALWVLEPPPGFKVVGRPKSSL